MDEKKKETVSKGLSIAAIAIGGLAGFLFLLLFVLIATDDPAAGGRIFLGIAPLVGFFVWYWKHLGKKYDKEKYQADNEFVRYEKGGVLILKKTSPQLKDMLSYKKYDAPLIKVHPEEIHVGAVTVGGVTSGGAYKTEAYTTAGGKIQTDKYALYYCKDKIYEIRFDNSEILEKAKNSTMASYINQRGILVVENHSNMTMEQLKALELQNNERSFASAIHAYIQGMPSEAKCKTIIDWLCSN